MPLSELSIQNKYARYKELCQQQTACVEETLQAAGVLTEGKQLKDFMQTNKLADRDENVFDVFMRATLFLAKSGAKFYREEQEEQVEAERLRFLQHVSNFEVILGSPILTNAGRRDKSISACSIPPVKLSQMTRQQISKVVGDYHSRGMGTGFSLDDVDDPVEMVKYLNLVAIGEVQRGEIERSVGNMGVLSINHPKVIEFIRVKRDSPEIKEWKFNLSVNLTDAFVAAWMEKKPFTLKNGTLVDPELLLRQMAENAHATGDPGLIFMDRINHLNRVPQVGRYKTVVPCGEVSLFEGEVCQFAYLNLEKFVNLRTSSVDREVLSQAVHSLVIMLDNAVEANIQRMPNEKSAEIISSVRRIGIGVCGLAESLQAMGFPYDSKEGREFAADLMSVINFESKLASIQLAKERGSFKHFDHSMTRTDFFIEPFKKHPTKFVSKADWDRLEPLFKKYKIRNVATTILPPTGRSSLIAGVTGSIEPPFRLVADSSFKAALEKQCKIHGYDGDLESIYEHVRATGSVQDTDLPASVKQIFKAALEISPIDHLLMTATCQQHIDEGISKTVNMVYDATIEDVQEIFRQAYHLNLKGITIYRDGCRTLQPKVLNMKADSSIVIDPLYGPISVSKRIGQLLASPLLQRLKGVHQNGATYLFDPRQSTSRYEHSLGTLALAQMLGGNESVQIAALLHDVSHTAFSHVVDLVFANSSQNYHDVMRDKFLSSGVVQQTIKECGVTESELACESIPLVKGKGLNVDRLDYCIRDLWAVNRIYHPQYSSILNNLVVNEQGEIVCKNIDTARLIFNKFLEANEEIYFHPMGESSSLIMATILRRMLEEGFILEEDFFTTDEAVVAKIKKSPFKQLFDAIGPNMQVSLSDSPTKQLPVLRKLRFVNPKIVGMPGVLTDHCKTSSDRLTIYLSVTPTKVFYKIQGVE